MGGVGPSGSRARYNPLHASLKETGCEGWGRMLYNISSFRGLYWYLVLTLGFLLSLFVVWVKNNDKSNKIYSC